MTRLVEWACLVALIFVLWAAVIRPISDGLRGAGERMTAVMEEAGR